MGTNAMQAQSLPVATATDQKGGVGVSGTSARADLLLENNSSQLCFHGALEARIPQSMQQKPCRMRDGVAGARVLRLRDAHPPAYTAWNNPGFPSCTPIPCQMTPWEPGAAMGKASSGQDPAQTAPPPGVHQEGGELSLSPASSQPTEGGQRALSATGRL